MHKRFRGSALPHMWAYFDADKGGAGAGGDPAPNQDANGGGEKPEGDGTAVFTAEQQEAINKLLGKARAEGRTAAENDAKRKADEAEAERKRKADEAAGKFEEVNKSLLSEIEQLKADKAAMELSALQNKVAAATGLPPQMAGKLSGKDEAEMTADAKAIIALFPAKTDAKTPPPGTSGNPPPKGTAAEAEAAKAAQANQANLYRSI